VSIDTGFRTIRYWVRYKPRKGIVGRASYRSKREAQKVKKRGEVLVNVSGMYYQPASREGSERG
jgi:hypothetical protein